MQLVQSQQACEIREVAIVLLCASDPYHAPCLSVVQLDQSQQACEIRDLASQLPQGPQFSQLDHGEGELCGCLECFMLWLGPVDLGNEDGIALGASAKDIQQKTSWDSGLAGGAVQLKSFPSALSRLIQQRAPAFLMQRSSNLPQLHSLIQRQTLLLSLHDCAHPTGERARAGAPPRWSAGPNVGVAGRQEHVGGRDDGQQASE